MLNASGLSSQTSDFWTPTMLVEDLDVSADEAPGAAGSRQLQTMPTEDEINTAIQNVILANAICVEYQPIWTKAGRLASVEALLRLRHRLLRQVGLAKYIDVAEHSGLIFSLGMKVLQATLHDLSVWHAFGAPVVKAAVNISARQLQMPEFSDWILRTTDAFGLLPTQLQLELTETSRITSLDTVAHEMQMLTDQGFTFALDDFGMGYSSLGLLAHLPISTLKIDKSFVHELGTSERTRRAVEGVMLLAKTMKLETVAEGIETYDQLQIMEDLGCDMFQGFLFSPSVPATKICEFSRATMPMRLSQPA